MGSKRRNGMDVGEPICQWVENGDPSCGEHATAPSAQKVLHLIQIHGLEGTHIQDLSNCYGQWKIVTEVLIIRDSIRGNEDLSKTI